MSADRNEIPRANASAGPNARTPADAIATRRIALALAAGALAIAAAAFGCGPSSRFPVCRSNEDCKKGANAGGGPVCFDLRCVECAHDTDGPAGSRCSTAGRRCDALEPRAAADDGASEAGGP